MKVFIDNNLSPTLAATINGFLQHSGGSAAHIRDLPCGRDAADVVWIEMLAREPDEWIVITGDLRIQEEQGGAAGFPRRSTEGVRPRLGPSQDGDEPDRRYPSLAVAGHRAVRRAHRCAVPLRGAGKA